MNLGGIRGRCGSECDPNILYTYMKFPKNSYNMWRKKSNLKVGGRVRKDRASENPVCEQGQERPDSERLNICNR